jgi:ribonucleoside-triphosphate reductase
MDIKLKLNNKFVAALNKLKEEYGQEFDKLNGFHNSNLNFTDFIDNFIDSKSISDVTIDANANSSSKDVRSMLADMMKPHTKLLSYNKIFYELTKEYGIATAEDWLKHEWNGAFYLHDAASSTLMSYCFAYDLEDVVQKGLYFINSFKPGPAKHLTTFNDHVLEFISWASNRTSGACGIPGYLVHSYGFWMNDVKEGFYLKNPEYYRRQCFQKFIYDLNQPYLRITECAFTNISIMDRNYLTEIFGGRQFPNGEFVIDHIDGILEHQKVFMETLAEIRKECMMTFPVVTFALLYQNGKFVDEEFAKWCNKHNMQWYDSNFYLGDNVANLSSCCRMVNDTSKVKKAEGFINSIGGSSISIGSIKVNTINLRRISLEANKDKEKFKNILTERTSLCIKVLHIIRKIITRNVEKGLLPNYTHGLIKMENQYNTIGLTAMYEVIKDFGFIATDEFGNKSYTKEGINFASDILDLVNKIKDEQTFDYAINIEVIPAERANVVLCQKDKVIYGEQEEFIYSNQWIPLMQQCTIQEKVKLGALLDKRCGGGQIMHVNLQGKFSSEEQSWDLLNYIAKSGVIYMAYNPRISVCEKGHGFFGEHCPTCGNIKIDEFTRIVGYLVPTNTYSKDRKNEFSKRYWYNLDD